MKISEGPFAPVDGAGYEYETGALLGSNCLIDDMEAISKANEMCNRYGIDTHRDRRGHRFSDGSL